MASNSFPTHDGGHVSGAVAMALDETGNAVPIEADTPIGVVGLEKQTVERICRALAWHAAIVTGGSPEDLAAELADFLAAPVRA